MNWFKSNSEERSLVGLNILFAFLIGGVQTFLTVIPLAIFLTTYSSSLLTYVYMSLGILVFFIGNIFRYFQKNLSFFQVLLTTLLVFSLSLFMFWGLLVGMDFDWIPMALIIWTSVANLFLSLVLNMLAIRIFTLQEGKAFFGIIGGSRALGGMIPGFLMPLLVGSIGNKTVFLFVPFLILIAISILFSIYKKHKDRFLGQKSVIREKQEKITFKKLKNKSYVLCIFILAIVSIFNYYSLDLLFNAEVKKQFSTQAEIAGFLGIFTGFSNFLTLIGGFFLFGLVLDKLGLIVTLFLTPLTVGGFILLTLVTNLIPPTLGLVFGVFSVAVLMERMMRQSINSESLNLLYTPLRPREREWAQIQYRINIQSISTSAIGAILLGVNLAWGISIASIGSLVIVISACGIATMFLVKRDYIKILVGALAKWALHQPEFIKLDKDSLRIIEGRLKSRFPEEVIFVLQTIESIEPKELPKALVEALDNSLADVRIYALNKIEQYRVQPAQEKITQICLSEKDPKILGPALRALGAIADLEQFPWFREHLQSANNDIASSCFIALILHGSEIEKREALELLTKSSNGLMVAMVLKEVDIPSKADLLLPLLSDKNDEVRLIACQAAADVEDERFYPALIENLSIAHLHYVAFQSLLKQAPTDYIFEHFDQFSRDAQSQLLNLLGFIKDERCIDFLQKFLTSPDRKFLSVALRGLENQSFKAKDRSQIIAILESENQSILFLREILASLTEEKTQLLQDLLSREIELIQESCFLLLTFIYPKEQILIAREGLTKKDRDKVSYAIEILLQTLSKEHANLLVHQLAPKSVIKQNRPVEDVLLKVLKFAPNCYIPAINSAVVYTIGVLGLKPLADLVRKDEAPNDPFLEEIRHWALKKLQV